jgi:hypothetical protein
MPASRCLRKVICSAESSDPAADDNQIEIACRFRACEGGGVIVTVAQAMRGLNNWPGVAVRLRVVTDPAVTGEHIRCRPGNWRDRQTQHRTTGAYERAVDEIPPRDRGIQAELSAFVLIRRVTHGCTRM